MNWLVLLIFVTSSCVFAKNDNITVEELTDSRTTYIWSPGDANFITVTAEPGYQIRVNVTKLDVDGESDDYVAIEGGTNDENSDTLTFSYTVSGNPSYLYNKNELKAHYVGSNKSDSFQIYFTRVGEAAKTTPEPLPVTTTEVMPTASPEESPSLTVYLYNRPAAYFGTVEIRSLREAIADMGAEYCKNQFCPLNETITWTSVKIENIEQCPILWNNYDLCIILKFSLPINKLEHQNSIWDGYQLNKDHLKIMWDSYAEEYMTNIGLALYSAPNVNTIFTSRLIVVSMVIVTLVILILVLRHIMTKLNERRRRLSDAISILNRPSNRNSQLSLTPHYLQELPPLFSNEFPIYQEHRGRKHFPELSDSYNAVDVSESSLPPNHIFSMSKDDSDEQQDADA